MKNWDKSYMELPSGRLVKIDDIIYVSDIKNKDNKYQVKVTWANRTTEIFEYEDEKVCQDDVYTIKTIIFS